MNIWYLCKYVAKPGNGYVGMRPFYLMNELSTMGCNIDLITSSASAFRTEDDQKENRSFMEDSDSHAQKVLIHSLAMDDNELFKLLETPDEIMHSSHQDPNLRITKHDRATSSPFGLSVV